MEEQEAGPHMTHSSFSQKAKILCLAVFLAWSSLAVSSTQETTASLPHHAVLTDFSWLAGRWEGHLGPMTAEQVWLAPKNGTMQGFFRLTNEEKTVVIELFTLRETPDGIAMYFRHFSTELKPWEETDAYRLNLTKSDATTFRFDNPVVNQLKDAILTHAEADTYTSHGDITDTDGKPKIIEVTYHRVK